MYDDKRSRLIPELAESLLLIKYNFDLVEKEYTYINFSEIVMTAEMARQVTGSN